MNGKASTASFVAIGAISLLTALPAHAQAEPGGQWHYLVQAYVLFPNMNGETGIRNLPTIPVDEDPGDIFDNLQMGAMLYLEARNDDWTFSSDLLYMNLGSDFRSDGPLELLEGDVDLTQTGWELAVMRRMNPWLELGIGATYNQIDVDLDLSVLLPGPPSQISAGLEENWIDPTIVSRVTFPINDKWFFQARGNIGGFGIGSDLMWQIMAHVGYRPSEKWSLAFGYRVIDIDYENGSGADHFIYDMQTFGPELRLGINF